MSDLFRVKDICLSCCECRSQKKKREFREQLFSLVVDADSEIRVRVDHGVIPHREMTSSAKLSDRLRLYCIVCQCKDGNSLVWQEVLICVLQPLQAMLAELADQEAEDRATMAQMPLQKGGKIVQMNFRGGGEKQGA